MLSKTKIQRGIKIIFGLTLLLNVISCKRPTHSEYPIVPANKILSSPEDLISYWNVYMKLAGDFQSLDTTGKNIPNLNFLQLLTTGKYLPLRLQSANDSLYYRLYPIDATASEDFGQIVKAYTQFYYLNYLRRGEKFPDFEYVDLNGNRYTSQSTKGKIMIIKFWFINCTNCVLEMPKCNQVMKEYRNRKDILFLSLTFDPPQKLKQFLKKKRFDMPVVPVKENYIDETLRVKSYPTIMIINKQDKISYICDSIDDFELIAKGL